MRQSIFIDTSGFFGLVDRSDQLHAQVTRSFGQAVAQGDVLVTCSYVVQETWSLIQARLGFAPIDALVDVFLPRIQVVWVDAQLDALARARCRQARQRKLSLTDCASIEVMRQRGIRTYLGRDEHFTREGFREA